MIVNLVTSFSKKTTTSKRIDGVNTFSAPTSGDTTNKPMPKSSNIKITTRNTYMNLYLTMFQISFTYLTFKSKSIMSKSTLYEIMKSAFFF